MPPFSVQRSAFLTTSQLEQIEEGMLRLLEEVGVAVLDEQLLSQIERKGFQAAGGRVLIERQVARDFVEHERARNGRSFSETPAPAPPGDAHLNVFVSNYPPNVHDLESDRVVPYTTAKLIEATKLVDVLASRGVVASPPGIPADVPPALQPVVQYWVAATYSRQGKRPIDPKAEVSFPYVMEMADVLGNPVRRLPVYVFSPLTLGGESLRCVLRFQDRLSTVYVSAMPSVGCTAPINLGDAFALAAAEIIGSSILLSEVLSLEIQWGIYLYPIDLRTMAMVFGSPENFLFQLMSHEVAAYFHGTPWSPAASNIHTNAKLPGPQACAEKSSLMTAGALLGARTFGAVGTLSLDEAFSPEQLLYDLEIRDHVERLVAGANGDCDPERCVRDVIEGVREGGLAGLETTLAEYRSLYWHPTLFDRQFLSAWQEQGAETIRRRTHAQIQELLSQHDYRLEPGKQRELDAILERAFAWEGSCTPLPRIRGL